MASLPEESPSGDSQKALEFKNKGNQKFNNNNYEGAIKDYKKGKNN